MVYRLHSVQLHNDGGSAVVFGDMLDLDTPLNPQHLAAIVAHRTSPTHASLAAIQPAFTFSSLAVAQILTQTGALGVPIDGDVNPGLTFYLGLIGDCGEWASGSVHRALTVSKGCLFPISVTAENRGTAQIQMGVAVISTNGTTAPLTITDGVALPAVPLPARWTIGPGAVGAYILSQFNSLGVAFGNTVITRGVESEIYDTVVEEKSHTPSISISGINPQWLDNTGGILSSIPFAGSSGNTLCYLRKRDRGGTFVANGTAQHVSFTLTGIASITDAARATAGRVAELGILATGADDTGGNRPLAINTATAIV